MEHVKRLSCAEANKMDLVDYLATIGYEPKKIRNNDHWYCSPFREEHTPSFKVDRRINKWYDHGEGKGGNLVDFGLAYYRCTIPELLSLLSGGAAASITPVEKRPHFISKEQENHIVITSVRPLDNPALLQYGQSRCIDSELLQQYCQQVNYTNGGKAYFGIGFKNDLGGYEIRSKYFKGSSSPKGITHLKTGADTLSVFEGFFNFLSFQQLHKTSPTPATDFLILNSLSFFEQSRPIMEGYRVSCLYLDNNVAGQKFAEAACKSSTVYQDKSSLYAAHEDLNDFLKSQPLQQRETQNRKPRLRL